MDIRLTQQVVEIYHKGKRFAARHRVPDVIQCRHTTIAEHMPKDHQRHAEWTPQRLVHWAQKTGEHTAKVF